MGKENKPSQTTRATVAGATAGDRTVITGSFYVGPIPSPEDLRGYEDVQAGLADRLVSMAEREQDHRHTQESLDGQEARSRARSGQWIAAALMTFMLAGGIVLAYTGREGTGATAIIGTLGMLMVNYFRYQRRDPIPSHDGDESPPQAQPKQ